MLNILIADDHFTVRVGLEMLTRSIPGDGYHFDHAASGEELLNKLSLKKYDLLYMDMQMPEPNGLYLLEKVRDQFPALSILVLSVHSEDVFSAKCLQLGARGYISKNENDDILKYAITEVMAGRRYLSDKILNNYAGIDGTPNPFLQLSARELDVTMLLLRGMGVLEVANALGINSSTASTFKGRIFKKLQVNSLYELEQISKQHNVFSPGGAGAGR